MKCTKDTTKFIKTMVMTILVLIATIVVFDSKQAVASVMETPVAIETEYHVQYTSISINYGDTLSEIAEDWYFDDQYFNNERWSFDEYFNSIIEINQIKNPDCITSGNYVVIPYAFK